MQQINTKKNKISHDWVSKVIHRELSKKLKFDHVNKWYMHNPESVQENKTQNSSEILKYKPIISARQPD